MESKSSLIEPLLERAEEYGKVSFELAKLKTLDKTADIVSTLLSRLIVLFFLTLFLLILSIGIALWLGDLLGKNYYGFLIVASFYGFIGIVLVVIHPFLKTRLNNSIVKQMFK